MKIRIRWIQNKMSSSVLGAMQDTFTSHALQRVLKRYGFNLRQLKWGKKGKKTSLNARSLNYLIHLSLCSKPRPINAWLLLSSSIQEFFLLSTQCTFSNALIQMEKGINPIEVASVMTCTTKGSQIEKMLFISPVTMERRRDHHLNSSLLASDFQTISFNPEEKLL